jgi:integrase
MRGTVAGRRINQSTGTHSRDHADHIRTQREKELLDERVHGRAVVATFAQAVELYWSVSGRDNSVAKNLPKLLAEFGTMKLQDFDEGTIHAYAIRAYPTAKNSSRNQLVIAPIVTVLKNAARSKLCARPEIRRLPDDSEIVRAPSQDVVLDFLERCPHAELKAFVTLLSTTGVRCGEALRIERAQVDPERNEIVLRPNQTKNGHGGILALTGALTQMLLALPPRTKLFKWSSTRSVNGTLVGMCRRLGIEQLSVHRVGRHFFAERMLALGYSAYDVARMGRWEDFDTFARRYGHLERKRTDDAVRGAAADLLRPKLKVVGGD